MIKMTTGLVLHVDHKPLVKMWKESHIECNANYEVPCPAHQVSSCRWVALAIGKNYACLHINTICHALGKDKSTALPIFDCYTDCDLGIMREGQDVSMGGL